jgi:Transposase DDE domain
MDQAKENIVKYVSEVVETVGKNVAETTAPKTSQLLNEVKELFADPKFLIQKSIRSLVDKDARVGYKTATDSFFGYKTEFTMTADERIITAVEVSDGSYCDGKYFDNLLEQTQRSGFKISAVLGDKGYFRKPILDTLKAANIESIIPVSEMVYKLDESKYSYNKDSGQWFCELGNHTTSSKEKTRKNGKVIAYTFALEQCSKCQRKSECFKGRDKSKILEVGVNTMDYYELSQKAKTDEFKQRFRKRASIEWKNGEMKRFHGLDRARGYGLRSMSIQAKFTALAVNLKRIASLVFSVFWDKHYSSTINWSLGCINF